MRAFNRKHQFCNGPTGGTILAMKKTVAVAHGEYAEIASHMLKQIVEFQAVMARFAGEVPCPLSGYTITVIELRDST